MRLVIAGFRPCTLHTPKQKLICCSTVAPQAARLGKSWLEYQGSKNWEGLLDPLDDNLRGEILRYGKFVEAAYTSFEIYNPSSPTATCHLPNHTVMNRLPTTGYHITKNLYATSGIQFPRWIDKVPSWVSNHSSWIGYVAVCQDEEEIARLGRRDIVVAYRGTATCLEWLENLRATLTQLPNTTSDVSPDGGGPMVESGFLSLYTSQTATCRSLQDEVREEIGRLLQFYGDEALSLTITGHSLGAALATLTAYDITTSFKHAPLVTVLSFGGPRVGNRSFRCLVEKHGCKILRIVNSDDLITKIPGFVVADDVEDKEEVDVADQSFSSWLQKHVEDNQWVYANVGRELRLCSRDSSTLTWTIPNVAMCHELDTYLDLIMDS